MSRAIQVRVSESVVRTIHVEDGVQSPLEMLPILDADRMGELLAAELEALGFLRDGDTAKRTDPDGIEVTVDLRGATVSVKLGASANLQEAIDRRATVGVESRESAEVNLRDDVIRELDERLAEKTEALRREVTGKLERKLADLRNELDGAIGRATVAALTVRAGELGSVESVVSDEAGNVTIRVKL